MVRRKGLIVLILLLIGLGAVVPVSRFVCFVQQPVAPSSPRIVAIAPGTSFAQIAHRLEAEGVVSDGGQLKWLGRWRRATHRIQAGQYAFVLPATPDQVLERLVAGDVVRYRFTVPEGLTLWEIAQRLEAEERGRAETFLTLARDPEFCRQLGVVAETLEGYLFPETYLLTDGMTERQLIRTMVREFERRLTPEIEAAARQQSLDRRQLVILASIIQKEAGDRKEMPLIAAVFHNRLRKGIPLQSDPTVIYGIEHFDGNLTRKHLRTPTPYNTYQLSGLPAGPIANPGEDALRAAAFPTASDYLYFVARGNGTHAFSRTLAEHNAKVRKYQLRR
ncbi:MAG: endolytic transglycosylase MltG [Desulfuromonadaceae bacterium]